MNTTAPGTASGAAAPPARRGIAQLILVLALLEGCGFLAYFLYRFLH